MLIRFCFFCCNCRVTAAVERAFGGRRTHHTTAAIRAYGGRRQAVDVMERVGQDKGEVVRGLCRSLGFKTEWGYFKPKWSISSLPHLGCRPVLCSWAKSCLMVSRSFGPFMPGFPVALLMFSKKM